MVGDHITHILLMSNPRGEAAYKIGCPSWLQPSQDIQNHIESACLATTGCYAGEHIAFCEWWGSVWPRQPTITVNLQRIFKKNKEKVHFSLKSLHFFRHQYRPNWLKHYFWCHFASLDIKCHNMTFSDLNYILLKKPLDLSIQTRWSDIG